MGRYQMESCVIVVVVRDGFPGPLGLVAFVGVKFGGYVLAGLALKKVYPSIVAGAAKIAAVRTGLGLFLGASFWFLSFKYLMSSPVFNDTPLIPYGWLVALRIVIWAVVISIFLDKPEGSTSKFLLFSTLGSFWSCLLDVPGILLAVVSPGRIPVC